MTKIIKTTEEVARAIHNDDLSPYQRQQFVKAVTQDRQDILNAVLALAPGFEDTRTGEVEYDAGVEEYKARIRTLVTELLGKEKI